MTRRRLKLPESPDRWPDSARYLLYERWNIMQFEGNLPEEEAWRLAVEEIRSRWVAGDIPE